MTQHPNNPALGFAEGLGLPPLRKDGAIEVGQNLKEEYRYLFDLEQTLNEADSPEITQACDILFDEVLADTGAIRARSNFLLEPRELIYLSLITEIDSLVKKLEDTSQVTNILMSVVEFLRMRRGTRSPDQPLKSVMLEKDYFNAYRIMRYHLIQRGKIEQNYYDIKNQIELEKVFSEGFVPKMWISSNILTYQELNAER